MEQTGQESVVEEVVEESAMPEEFTPETPAIESVAEPAPEDAPEAAATEHPVKDAVIDETGPEATEAGGPVPEEPATEARENDEYVESVPTDDVALPTVVMSEEFFSAAVSESALNVIEVAERELRSLLEAIVYITDEPLSAQQIATAIERPLDQVQKGLDKLVELYEGPEHGLTIRELAGGYKMGTKPEHHEGMRTFVKKMKPPLKLSLAALETLAVIAYKQPATGPEIMEIRGVQGGGVMKTLLDRKLIASAGRKNVVGKPMMYKTTREFLLQFGLKDLAELPTLKEFEELKRLALTDPEDSPTDVDGPATPEEAAAAAEATADRGEVGAGNDRANLDELQAEAEHEEPLPHPVAPMEEPPQEELPHQDPPADDEAPVEEPPSEDEPKEEH
jgi:segregation and condensation protein B